MSPAIAPDAGLPGGAIDALTASGGQPASSGPGAGAEAQRAQLGAFMQKLRDLDQQITTVFSEMPALAPVATQLKTLLKTAVQNAAKTAPPQTASSDSVPTASQ